ncbi:dienelactone hydrolase family protein [Microlunatus soli]|uniref:Carboxymethylenebutenolidase n=1 Tax=Microlunatus soli TaxID=630515 RepID=A0A1H1QTE8_9ACTN|nr:dienelactone hydrolase family protein [Microlunatus soli]SDS26761.1 carboxymethylenebutenolidase [Microlunatus soli]
MSASKIEVFKAIPSGEIKGGLLLIHEIWGLVDHIRDVAGRFAEQGYLTYAPDILSKAGMTPKIGQELVELSNDPDEEKRVTVQPLMREKAAPAFDPEYAEWAVATLRGVVDELADQPGVDGRLAVLGFCFGGTYSFALAAADDRIKAAVPFYGAPADLGAVSAIGCPVLAIYGDQDERLMTGLPDVEAAMKAAGVDFTAKVYPGAAHAFFNDAGPRYDEKAATDAWQLSLDFLRRSL